MSHSSTGLGGLRKLTNMAEEEANMSSFTQRQEGEVRSKGGKPPYKTIRSRENLLSWEQHGGNHPHYLITSHRVPPTTCGDYGSYNSRWDLGGDATKLYHATPNFSQTSCPHISKHNHAFPTVSQSQLIPVLTQKSKSKVSSVTRQVPFAYEPEKSKAS